MIRHPKFFLLLSAALFISSLHAQLFRSKRPGHLDSMMTFWNTQDTNYIRKYPDRFIVTLSQSFREYDVGFSQTLVQDTAGWGAPDLVANANKSNSISVDFDKISFCLGLNTVPPTDDVLRKRGKTTYKTLTLSFGAYRFRFETGYRSYHGFYDKKTPAYDSLFDSTGVYYQDPSMNVRSLRVKTIFIFNKRHFSYNSAYFNTQRQLKTSGSLLLCNNLYDDRFSSDTSMIPRPSRFFYERYGDLNYFRVQGISIGPGYSFNLVLWKTLYFNGTATSGFDFQHRSYGNYSTGTIDKFWKVGFAGDLRFAIGLNGKHMFASATYRVDYNSYVTNGMRIYPFYQSIDFNIGYRFPFKERKWVKKMKANKWYQML